MYSQRFYPGTASKSRVRPITRFITKERATECTLPSHLVTLVIVVVADEKDVRVLNVNTLSCFPVIVLLLIIETNSCNHSLHQRLV